MNICVNNMFYCTKHIRKFWRFVLKCFNQTEYSVDCQYFEITIKRKY